MSPSVRPHAGRETGGVTSAQGRRPLERLSSRLARRIGNHRGFTAERTAEWRMSGDESTPRGGGDDGFEWGDWRGGREGGQAQHNQRCQRAVSTFELIGRCRVYPEGCRVYPAQIFANNARNKRPVATKRSRMVCSDTFNDVSSFCTFNMCF